MRLTRYIQNEHNILGCYYLFDNLNEMSDKTFDTIRRLGSKVGLKIERSNPIFKQLKRAGKGIEDLIRYATLYSMVDIGDSQSKKELESDMKNTLKHVNKREVVDFFMQLDKNLFHLTSIPRHILSSLFGIHITSYHEWKEDHDYIKDELKKIEIVMDRIQKETGKDLSKELNMIRKLQQRIDAME